jgi:uncharacterized DUF497 family protein
MHTALGMKIDGIIWLENIIDKLLWKHHVTPGEVEEVFNCSPRYRFFERGDVEGEDLYLAMGRTEAGRYLIVYFLHKVTGEALVISARDMTKKERRLYGKK